MYISYLSIYLYLFLPLYFYVTTEDNTNDIVSNFFKLESPVLLLDFNIQNLILINLKMIRNNFDLGNGCQICSFSEESYLAILLQVYHFMSKV